MKSNKQNVSIRNKAAHSQKQGGPNFLQRGSDLVKMCEVRKNEPAFFKPLNYPMEIYIQWH